jgi:hypothetical protein
VLDIKRTVRIEIAWPRLRTLLAAVCLTATWLWVSCSGSESSRLAVSPGLLVALPLGLGTGSDHDSSQTIVLVAIDGVRWQEIFGGVDARHARRHGLATSELLDARDLVPNLHALGDAGAAINGGAGERMLASGPNYLSLPGYKEMLTGLGATGCIDNQCGPIGVPTIVDELAALPDVTPDQVAVIASWEGVGLAAARDPSRITISVGRTQGKTRDRLRFDPVARALLEAGEQAGPTPGVKDFRRDPETAEIALHYLRTHRPRFLFLGLGEPDEYGHRNDYRGYLRSLAYADNVVGRLTAVLADYEREGRRTTLVVTTDHGRAHDFIGHGAHAPESAEVWLVAAGWGIRRLGVVAPSKRRRLADVATTIRSLAGLESAKPDQPFAKLLQPAASRFDRPPWHE